MKKVYEMLGTRVFGFIGLLLFAGLGLLVADAAGENWQGVVFGISLMLGMPVSAALTVVDFS